MMGRHDKGPSFGLDPQVLDYLMQKRKPAINDTNQMGAALTEASAAMGTLKGAQADTSNVGQLADKLDSRNYEMENSQRQRRAMMAQQLQEIKNKNTMRAQGLADRSTDRENLLKDRKQAREWQLEDRNYNAQLLKQKNSSKPSKAQEYIDKEFGKEYGTFVQGGKEVAAQNIAKLRGNLKLLEDQKDDFWQVGGGPVWGSLPDWLRDADSIKIRDEITGIAMEGLKDTFGGQISDGERKALAATFYNDSIPPNENIPIIKRKLAQLENTYKNKVRMARHFQEHGTLANYEGLTLRDQYEQMRDKDPMLMMEEPKVPSTNPTPNAGVQDKPSFDSSAFLKKGKTAPNPTTGEMMIKADDGLWYPAQKDKNGNWVQSKGGG